MVSRTARLGIDRSAVSLLLSYNLPKHEHALRMPVGLADALLAEAAVACVHRAAEGLEARAHRVQHAACNSQPATSDMQECNVQHPQLNVQQCNVRRPKTQQKQGACARRVAD